MKSARQRRFACGLLSAALLAWPAVGADITGRVRNATTGKPAADVFVGVLSLQGQMETIAQTMTGSDGRYRIELEGSATGRFLVQASFQGVNYNLPVAVSGGETVTADITVYESGADPADISIAEHAIIVEPQTDHVRFTEIQLLENRSDPPRSHAPDGASFTFGVPEGATELQVSVSTQSGIPLKQQPQEAAEGENHFYLTYAFRPGVSQVRVSYELPLSGNSFEARLPLAQPARGRFVVIPAAGVDIKTPGLEEEPQDISPDRRIFRVQETQATALALELAIDLEALSQLEDRAAAASPPAPQNTGGVVTMLQPLNENPRQLFIVALILSVLVLGLYYLSSINPSSQKTDDATAQSGTAGAD